MADVVIRAPIDADISMMIREMSEVAVSRALERARVQIRAYAREITPQRTGTLADSFDVGMTPRQIHMKWDAVDKRGYHYAKVVDQGRPGGVPIRARPGGWLRFFWEAKGIPMRIKQVTQGPMWGAYFAEQMRNYAPQVVREMIIQELQGMTIS
jgi:hypothetical protein